MSANKKSTEAALASNATAPEDLADAQSGPVDSDEERDAVLSAVSRAFPRPIFQHPLISVAARTRQIRLKDVLANALGGTRGAGLFSTANASGGGRAGGMFAGAAGAPNSTGTGGAGQGDGVGDSSAVNGAGKAKDQNPASAGAGGGSQQARKASVTDSTAPTSASADVTMSGALAITGQA